MIFVSCLAVALSLVLYIVRSKIAAFDQFFSKRGSILLLIAHPDDEVMFFLPTMKRLLALGKDLIVVCLSTGDADGLGTIRKKEFIHVMETLDVQKSLILDDKRIPDGFNLWDATVVCELIEKVIGDNPTIDTLLTFDIGGVSGHPNHVSIARASELSFSRKIELVKLKTVPTLTKYAFPPFDLILPWKSELLAVLNIGDIFACANLMRLYNSQNVWFRRLFTLFSRYAYINTLEIK